MSEIPKYFVQPFFHKPFFRAPRILYKLMVSYEACRLDAFAVFDHFTAEKCLYTSPNEGMIIELAEKLNAK